MDVVVLQEERVVLRFELLGYQFPKVEDQEWDSDWLLVRLHLQCNTGTPSGNGPIPP
ncbi:WapI family immunity protein [Deinococcus apachensis]|uniref:WapI family immunity protein n=1 Tax=Deinococcus apachensis TaxID=309886 RepID=UPI00036F460D